MPQSNEFGEIKRPTSSFDSQKVEAFSANFKVFFRKYKCQKYTLTHFGTNKAAMYTIVEKTHYYAIIIKNSNNNKINITSDVLTEK